MEIRTPEISRTGLVWRPTPIQTKAVQTTLVQNTINSKYCPSFQGHEDEMTIDGYSALPAPGLMEETSTSEGLTPEISQELTPEEWTPEISQELTPEELSSQSALVEELMPELSSVEELMPELSSESVLLAQSDSGEWFALQETQTEEEREQERQQWRLRMRQKVLDSKQRMQASKKKVLDSKRAAAAEIRSQRKARRAEAEIARARRARTLFQEDETPTQRAHRAILLKQLSNRRTADKVRREKKALKAFVERAGQANRQEGRAKIMKRLQETRRAKDEAERARRAKQEAADSIRKAREAHRASVEAERQREQQKRHTQVQERHAQRERYANGTHTPHFR